MVSKRKWLAAPVTTYAITHEHVDANLSRVPFCKRKKSVHTVLYCTVQFSTALDKTQSSLQDRFDIRNGPVNTSYGA